MATKKYSDWIYYFYHGIRRYNPDIKIVIYLINYTREEANLLRSFFNDVEFIEKKGNFKLKETYNEEGLKECVTYLKGQFMYETTYKYKKPCLWIDITALIRTELSELTDMLSQNHVILNRRNFDRTEGQRVMAAEIFGINSIEMAKLYANVCNSNVTNWYQDQESLCEFLKHDIKIGYIKFGDYSNFHFEPQAKSWSDRGRTGNGTFNKEDNDHNFEMFYNDLKDYDMFSKDYELYKGLFDKSKTWIMCYIDEDRWCYYTTAMMLSKLLSKWFYISIVRDVHIDREVLNKFQGELIWARCNAHRASAISRIRPELAHMIIPTVTTGGELLQSRIDLHKQYSKSEYVLTQNYEAYKSLNKDFVTCLIPNGVDTKRFSPVPRNPQKRFIVGFAGRKGTTANENQKGFKEYFQKPCEELGLEYTYCDAQGGFIEHHEMHKFYNKIDILIQASHSEGCSNTIHEAMSCFPYNTNFKSYSDIEIGHIRNYKGDMIHIETKTQELDVTPNHYFLTQNGWVKAKDLNTMHDIYILYGKETIKKQREKLVSGRIGDIATTLGNKNGSRNIKIVGQDSSSNKIKGWKWKLGNKINEKDCELCNYVRNKSNRKRKSILSRIYRCRWLYNFKNTKKKKLLSSFNNYIEYKYENTRMDTNEGFKRLSSIKRFYWKSKKILFIVLYGLKDFAFTRSDLSIFSNKTGTMWNFDYINKGKTRSKLSKFLSWTRKKILGKNKNIKQERIELINKYNYTGKVYNIKTDNGIYFANNVLVHNCGIPCIITKVGYHGEVCEDNHNVLFVERDKEQIKEALIKLKDEKFYNKISNNARSFALKHTWEETAYKFSEVFKQIIKNN